MSYIREQEKFRLVRQNQRNGSKNVQAGNEESKYIVEELLYTSLIMDVLGGIRKNI